MSDTAPLVTAEQLEQFPRDDRRYELVRGRVVPMTPVNVEHGRVVVRAGSLIAWHLQGRDAGIVGAEIGFILATDPDTVRAPDVAFIRRDRMPPRDARGFFKGAPDVAIEVLSPDDRPSEVREKVEEYLAHGVAVAIVIDPQARTVAIHRPLTPATTFRADDDVIDLEDAIPEFRCRLREIFE